MLLLQQDLHDKDIPHRMKLREAIIKAWQVWFIKLKEELAVYSRLTVYELKSNETIVRCRSNQLHGRCLV
jgi:hypothetical protein